jgi:hypothetical protein
MLQLPHRSSTGRARDRSPRRRARRRACSSKRSIDSIEKGRALVVTIDRKPVPTSVLPQVCEEAGAILVKMQKSPSFEIKDPWSALGQSRAGPETFQ